MTSTLGCNINFTRNVNFDKNSQVKSLRKMNVVIFQLFNNAYFYTNCIVFQNGAMLFLNIKVPQTQRKKNI